VLTGESFPLFISSTANRFQVTAFRLGWYGGAGARLVWRSGPLTGHRQRAAGRVSLTPGPANTVRADWDPAVQVPTDDWQPGSYLLRLDAEQGAQRYVPITVRSASTAGKLVIKNYAARSLQDQLCARSAVRQGRRAGHQRLARAARS
jgi:hypothetical protein